MQERNNDKYLVVISGPSGSGKDTIAERLLIDNNNMSLSVSYTSRKKRDYEVDGVHYFFTSREKFLEMKEKGLMLETVEYNGNYYGTPLPELYEKLESKKTVILVIDVKGAMRVKELFPEALLVFIVPPSMEELEERLKKRSTETEDDLKSRMEIAKHEMTFMDDYNVIMVNDEVDKCKEQLLIEIKKWQDTH